MLLIWSNTQDLTGTITVRFFGFFANGAAKVDTIKTCNHHQPVTAKKQHVQNCLSSHHSHDHTIIVFNMIGMMVVIITGIITIVIQTALRPRISSRGSREVEGLRAKALLHHRPESVAVSIDLCCACCYCSLGTIEVTGRVGVDFMRWIFENS